MGKEMEYKNLKVGDLLKQTRPSKWAIWEIKRVRLTSITCKLVAYTGTGWASSFSPSEKRYYSITPKLKYIGNIDDFPELLL